MTNLKRLAGIGLVTLVGGVACFGALKLGSIDTRPDGSHESFNTSSTRKLPKNKISIQKTGTSNENSNPSIFVYDLNGDLIADEAIVSKDCSYDRVQDLLGYDTDFEHLVASDVRALDQYITNGDKTRKMTDDERESFTRALKLTYRGGK